MLGFILGIILMVIYHKMVDVYYFGSMGKGLLREFFISQLIGYAIIQFIGAIFGSVLGLLAEIIYGAFIMIVLGVSFKALYIIGKEVRRRFREKDDSQQTFGEIFLLLKEGFNIKTKAKKGASTEAETSNAPDEEVK